jgi:hypothetical protein
MNCTRGAKQMINQRRISQKSLRPGFTPIFAKKATLTHCWDKFLGDHTIMSHSQIGWICNATGKRTKMAK